MEFQANWQRLLAREAAVLHKKKGGDHHGERLCGQMVQFKNNITHENAKNLGISSSMVHNIIKTFRGSGEICVCERWG